MGGDVDVALEVDEVLVEVKVLEWIVSVVGSLFVVLSVVVSVEVSVVVSGDGPVVAVPLVVGVAVVGLLAHLSDEIMQEVNHNESVMLENLPSDGSMVK